MAEESSAGFSEQFKELVTQNEQRMKAIQEQIAGQWESQRKAIADLIEEQWKAQQKAIADLIEQQRSGKIADQWEAQRKAITDQVEQQWNAQLKAGIRLHVCRGYSGLGRNTPPIAFCASSMATRLRWWDGRIGRATN